MPQFTVYRNKNPQTLSTVPFLLNVQHDLLSDLETRVVIPASELLSESAAAPMGL
jgi:toxin CcdB